VRIARLRVEGFRGIRTGEFAFQSRSAIIGPNGCGKSTIIDALSLVLGRARMVRALTEHDFTGSNPKPADRIRIIATVAGFSSNDPDRHTDWFRMGRAVPKWLALDGGIHASPTKDRELAAQVALSARFDHDELTVETKRYFHDDDDHRDPFVDDVLVEQVPTHLINDVGYFVLPARRSWEGVSSFNSDLFRRTVSNAAGIPASEILAQRDALRAPLNPIESSPALEALVGRINDQLGRMMIQKPKFQLRVTSGDSEAVLQALLPHYQTAAGTLPASRHGMGLVSLQSLVLLLEVGRSRKANGLSFVLGLEEPELHLAPGLQGRLLAEAIGLADQTLCTTHSPRVAGIYEPTSIYVMTTESGVASAKPFLTSPLAQSASNNERKLYLQNRSRVVEALMHPHVIVPEGRFDAEWLLRLADLAESTVSKAPPFTTVFGILPTENASVVFSIEAVRRLRTGIVGLVDGDAAGDAYAEELAKLVPPPQQIIQWPVGWTIEDVVGWVLVPGGQEIIGLIADDLGATWKITSASDLVRLLKTKNDTKAKQFGLKEDVLAHDVVIAAIRTNVECMTRAAEVCDCLVQIALGEPHARIRAPRPSASVPLFRVDLS
jgi:putative ATP-dependent endonuclease of the OLD family